MARGRIFISVATEPQQPLQLNAVHEIKRKDEMRSREEKKRRRAKHLRGKGVSVGNKEAPTVALKQKCRSLRTQSPSSCAK